MNSSIFIGQPQKVTPYVSVSNRGGRTVYDCPETCSSISTADFVSSPSQTCVSEETSAKFHADYQGSASADSSLGSGVREEFAILLDATGRTISRKFELSFSRALAAMGANGGVCASARHYVRNFLADDDEQKFISKAKKFCQSFSAQLFETDGCHYQQLPGAFGRWVTAQMNAWGGKPRVRPRSVTFAESMFQCKTLLGYSTERMKIDAYKAHASKVASASLDDTHVELVKHCLRPLLDEVSLTIREKFEVPHHLSFSAKSCVASTISVGGKLGSVVRSFDGIQVKPGNVYDSCQDALLAGDYPTVPWTETKGGGSEEGRWSFHPSDYYDLRLPGKVVPNHFRDELDDFQLIWACRQEEPRVRTRVEFTREGRFVTLTETTYPRTESQLRGFVLAEAQRRSRDPRARTTVQSTIVSEYGGKCRMITKGDEFVGSVTLTWQQAVFDGMKNTGFFPSLSRKFCATDLEDTTRFRRSDSFIASRDFESASDLLNNTLTDWICDRLTVPVGFPLPEVVLSDNGPKKVLYPPCPVEDVDCDGRKFPELGRRRIRDLSFVADNLGRKWGLWDSKCKMSASGRFLVNGEVVELALVSRESNKDYGQLMGQSSSFPLLCLVNAGISIFASGIHLGLWSDENECLSTPPDVMRAAYDRVKGTFFVNGDDGVQVTNSAAEEAFWKVSNSLGLRRSPGKSHTSDRFAVFNGQRYFFSGNWRRLPILYSQLLEGLKKLQSDGFDPKLVITPLFENCPIYWKDRVTRMYRERWEKDIYESDLGMPLGLACSLGGWGQELPPSWKESFTTRQIWAASQLVASQPFADFSVGPKLAPWTEAPVTRHIWESPVDLFSNDVVKREIQEAVRKGKAAKKYQGKWVLKPKRQCTLCLVSWRPDQIIGGECPCCSGKDFRPSEIKDDVYSHLGEFDILSEEELKSFSCATLVTDRQRPGFGEAKSTEFEFLGRTYKPSVPIGLISNQFELGKVALPQGRF